METYTADGAFPFSALVLGSPRPVQGGAHFTQASLGPGRPLYVQLPRCTFKQGIVTTKRGCYCDLMYDKGQAEGLVEWLLALESAAQEQIYKQREAWFHTELSRDDIESMLTPMSRLYRSGRSILIRTQLRMDRSTGKPNCTVYDERETSLDLGAIEADPQVTVIPLVLIDGVKFSSRSFEIDVRLVQLMVLDPRPEPAVACLIRHAKPCEGPQALAADTAAPVPDVPLEVEAEGEKEDEPATAAAAPAEADEEATAGDTPTVSFPPEAEEEPSPCESPEEPRDGLTEVDVGVSDDEAPMTLRKPDEVYREIYRSAKRKAKQMRAAAMAALLEAQQIKAKYVLDDIEESEDEESVEAGLE